MTADYTARQVDVPALVVGAANSVTKPSALRIDESNVIAGTQKALQAFVSLLFTVRGSSRNAAVGCEFLTALTSGRIRTDIDLRNYFSSEASAVVTQVNSGSYYSDERIASVTVEAAALTRTTASLRLRFVMDSGESTAILLPIPRT